MFARFRVDNDMHLNWIFCLSTGRSLFAYEAIDYLSLFKDQLIPTVNVISHIAVHSMIYRETWIKICPSELTS